MNKTLSIRILSAVLLGLMVDPLASAATSGTASLSGSILGDDGKAAPGATLVYQKLPEYSTDRNGRMLTTDLGFSGAVVVGSDGAFAVTGLPSGTYFICAKPAAQASQVSDCVWDIIPVVAVSDGQSLTKITRHIHAASTLTVVVNDPNGRIALPDAYGNVAMASRFFLGVYSTKIYVRTGLVSSSTPQKTYSVAYPQQRSIQLFIDTELSVTDGNGSPVETRQPTSLTIAPGSPSQVNISLNIQ